ncbi:hypothetical protein GOB94_09215 [Granulicella sp. 5B5]|uniref:hypothetical protein n=1 Tax=Granulicella sp. 5B5 TaxID=1617967 RepID=UPI0015F42AE7|nr:hypothetical protein [Granulicella sp. 5B5]QMV18841.1 hypothetical protein GOB94_09215 [Granulicella sp. 5B5]
MQNAKDTFYEVLRNRIAALNPGRTTVVRGITRPAILVEENELPTEFHLPDCFRVRWLQMSADANGCMPLMMLPCAIEYETPGTSANGGMDRGRTLAALDGELLAVLNQWPQSAQKNNYTPLSNGQPAAPMAANIWWGEPAFGAIEVKQDRLARTVTVVVMSYQEAGEL